LALERDARHQVKISCATFAPRAQNNCWHWLVYDIARLPATLGEKREGRDSSGLGDTDLCVGHAIWRSGSAMSGRRSSKSEGRPASSKEARRQDAQRNVKIRPGCPTNTAMASSIGFALLL